MISILTNYRTLAATALLAATLTACSDDPIAPPTNNGIQTPTTFTFASRFDSTKSSVSYEGQVVRNLLIQDISVAISALSKPGAAAITEADLLKLYEHADADNLLTKTTVDGRQLLETKYNLISTGKKLSDKISKDPLVGMTGNADELVRGWLKTIARNSQDPAKLGTTAVYIDENGVDLSQMVNKVLLGSVAYYQGTSVYFAGVVDKDNAVAADDGKGGKLTYTVMEHNWDEAFGYFGAARDFARYTDAQLSGTSADYTYDANGDGKIDARSEFNYAFARNAGKRDMEAGTDFTKEAFDAFLAGRTAIVNQSTKDAIGAQRLAAAKAWEKVIAATVLHYSNEVKTQMSKLGTAEAKPAELSKVWSEMKGYLIAMQYNSFKVITNEQLTQLHMLLGDKPVLTEPSTAAHTEYLTKIDAARAILKSTYGFSDAQMTAW